MGFTDDGQVTVGADPDLTGDATEDELATGWASNADEPKLGPGVHLLDTDSQENPT